MRIFYSSFFFCLLFTVIVGTITVIERKVLALIQRRVGPQYAGYRGRAQFVSDAIKLLFKHINILFKFNKILVIIFPLTLLSLSYIFWLNLIWGYNLGFFEFEYNLIIISILSGIFSILLFCAGISSKNKYAALSSYRTILVTLNLELLLNFIIICFLCLVESFSFTQLVLFQTTETLGIVTLVPTTVTLIVIFLVETGRIPFDLAEAEAELIAGYTTEFGGFFFTLFYLSEYFHLYCFSVVYTISLFGG